MGFDASPAISFIFLKLEVSGVLFCDKFIFLDLYFDLYLYFRFIYIDVYFALFTFSICIFSVCNYFVIKWIQNSKLFEYGW